MPDLDPDCDPDSGMKYLNGDCCCCSPSPYVCYCYCNAESADEADNGVDITASENIIYKVSIKRFLSFSLTISIACKTYGLCSGDVGIL